MSRRPIILIGLLSLSSVFASSSAASGFDFSAYTPAAIAEAYSSPYVDPEGDFTLDSRVFKHRVVVTVSDNRRKIEQSRLDLIRYWVKGLQIDPAVVALFEHEIEVSADGQSYWLPIQTPLIEPYEQELEAGAEVTLFIMYVGAVKADQVFVINEFQASEEKPR